MLVILVCVPLSAALRQTSHTSGPSEAPGKIPKIIWVTGEWSPGSTEVSHEVAHNLGRPIRKSEDVRWQTENKFGKWVPLGSYIRYFTNVNMDMSVKNISKMLDSRGIRGVDKAYFNLRPGAFRADVWRLLVLWAEGGVYLDANINLKCSLRSWIDFSKDELVLVQDGGVEKGYWNAMMAAAPQNRYIEQAIKDIVEHIQKHYYGQNPLSITGPIALSSSFRKQSRFPKDVRIQLLWKDRKVMNKTGKIMATKDEKIHYGFNPSKHYDPMWHHRQVYCDQAGPEPDYGRCSHR